MSKYEFTELKFDSDLFGVACAKVTLNERLSSGEFDALLNEAKAYSFVTVNNVCSDSFNRYLLGTRSHAFLTDTPVTLSKKTESAAAQSGVRPVLEEDIEPLSEISGTAFSKSRFASDPLLDKEKVSELYSLWVENAFLNGEKTLLTTDLREGFVICDLSEEICHIDLLAVSESARGKGIGQKLLCEVQRLAFEKGCTEMLVGTQAANVSALRLYEKCGFRVAFTSQTYHLHN